MEKSEKMVVGNMSFDVESVKGMTLEDFKKAYAGQLRKVDIEVAYNRITGGTVKRDKKPKKSFGETVIDDNEKK